MRGYFAIGVEGIGKEMNVGNLFRSAHAFGASFVFTVSAADSRSGVEPLDEAEDPPSFGRPRCAAYVLGPERGSLSPDMVARCDRLVRIPTRFCINRRHGGRGGDVRPAHQPGALRPAAGGAGRRAGALARARLRRAEAARGRLGPGRLRTIGWCG